AVSWNLLVGIIITLFALRLGASSTYIGFMSATFYIALFLLPFGKLLARRFSIIGIFSFTWIARSLCMVLAAAAPFFDYAGYKNIALLLVMIGVLLFHIFRGIGMIGNNPVLSLLASGPDRGSYMTQIQITNSAIAMSGSFLIAMALGMEPPVIIFSVLLSAGVITGVISGCMIKKVPEPSRPKDGHGMKLADIFKEAFSQDHIRHFIFIFFLIVLVSGVTRTFVVVYAREAFMHNDGLISLYSVFGGLGFLMAGIIVKFLVDRLGARPLFLVSVTLGLICLIAAVFFPQSAAENMTGSILFMVFLFFMLNFGFLGSEGIAQTYFFGLIPSDKMMDMGILYFFILGTAGATGTFLSGILIDILLMFGLSPFVSFKILFIIMIGLTSLALAMRGRMKPLGSLPLTDALEVIFSFRDLRAISLLDRLDKAEDSQEEQHLLGELHNTPSHLAVDGLLERARSPKLATRFEAIRALEKMHTLSPAAHKALMDDAHNNHFTTAYISARIMGNHKYTQAIPLLHKLAASDDYMLAGEAVVALAKMRDESFRHEIENLVRDSPNPRLKIMGAEALGLYRSGESIPVLLDVLRGGKQPPYLRDEVILAIAAILDTQKKFYKILVRYSADNSLASTLALDEAEATQEFVNKTLMKKKSNEHISIITMFTDYYQDAIEKFVIDKNGAHLSSWISEFPDEYSRTGSYIRAVLAKAVVDSDLCNDDRLRLLIVHWASQGLRIWAAMIK
ncbi:MAG: MFS transporter, partial [Treponema sp.]|nr:MFS transporter [Treponema sp.]